MIGKSHVIQDMPCLELPFKQGSDEWKMFQSRWVFVGVCPRPKTNWQWFIHHVCHGAMMGFPLLDVLVWSWRERIPDDFDIPEDEVAIFVREYPVTTKDVQP